MTMTERTSLANRADRAKRYWTEQALCYERLAIRADDADMWIEALWYLACADDARRLAKNADNHLNELIF